MKQITVLFSLIVILTSTNGQEIKNLYPNEIRQLDFSQSAQNEWALRDKLMEQIESGEKEWDNLPEEESAILMKYGEVYEDIWDIVGGGCSWYCGGGPKKVTASSYLKTQGKNNYYPHNAHDLNYKNAWVEGVDGYGIGEYLLYQFDAAAPRITNIIVVNGYVKSQSAWTNNSRVKKLKMYISDKPYAILNLDDKIAEQIFKVAPIGNSPDVRDNVTEQKDWTIKFEILEVYEGAKYDDVVIAEIYFDGLDVHCFAKGTKIKMDDNSEKNIEDLVVGDSVSCIDVKTNKKKSAKIEKLERVKHGDLVTYTFESGLSITATQDHPFLIKNKGWCSLAPDKSKQYKGFEEISKMQIGDLFLTSKKPDKLLSIDYLDGLQETYTISKLSSGDNFIANGFIVGVEEIDK